MRYLSLGYSDFFGDENVLVGNNADKEARLELNILRREVGNLMCLTEKQVGNLKRITHAKEVN